MSVSQLTEENKQLKEGISQLKTAVTQLNEENQQLKDHILQLKKTMALSKVVDTEVFKDFTFQTMLQPKVPQMESFRQTGWIAGMIQPIEDTRPLHLNYLTAEDTANCIFVKGTVCAQRMVKSSIISWYIHNAQKTEPEDPPYFVLMKTYDAIAIPRSPRNE